MTITLRNKNSLIEVFNPRHEPLEVGTPIQIPSNSSLYVVDRGQAIETISHLEKALSQKNTPRTLELGLWEKNALSLEAKLALINHIDSMPTHICIEYPFHLDMDYMVRITNDHIFLEEFFCNDSDSETFLVLITNKLQMVLKRAYERQEFKTEDEVLHISNQFLAEWGLIIRWLKIHSFNTHIDQKSEENEGTRDIILPSDTLEPDSVVTTLPSVPSKPQMAPEPHNCRACQKPIAPEANFCHHCGKKVAEDPPSCSRCEELRLENAKFCHCCGLDFQLD